MAQGSTVEFDDVFVVRETETALLCRIGDTVRWVAHSRLQPGRTVEHPGDLGVLVLAWDFAVEFWDGAMSDKRRRPLCDGVRLGGLPCRVARLPGSRSVSLTTQQPRGSTRLRRRWVLPIAKPTCAWRREKPAHEAVTKHPAQLSAMHLSRHRRHGRADETLVLPRVRLPLQATAQATAPVCARHGRGPKTPEEAPSAVKIPHYRSGSIGLLLDTGCRVSLFPEVTQRPNPW